MNFPKFQELVEKRTGFRTMENPMASGEYFSDSCGDGTATCSLLVDLARGKTLDEAYAISDADIEAELDGYPEKKRDYPARSIAALRVAIDDYRAKRAAGKITDEMLAAAAEAAAKARATEAAAAPAPAPQPAEPEKILIKLH